MSKGCVYLPAKGRNTFIKLKKNFGYETAAMIYNKVTGNEFLDMFADTLTLDSEGVPTYQSIIKNPLVTKYVGKERVLEVLSSEQLVLDNKIDNVATLITAAEEFNKGEYSDTYVAIVDYTDNDKITVKIKERTSENLETAQHQLGIQRLNEKVSELLSPLGITMSELSRKEVAIGKVGLTNFNHAMDIASGFTGLMQVANNLEGHTAVSEEFAHFVIGVYRNEPLVQRAINQLKNEDLARQVLGEQFDAVYNNYGGNMDMVAEEAAGHILRDQLLEKNNKVEKLPIFKRAVNFIVNLFKGLNPGYYQNAIDNVTSNLGRLAENILSSKKIITKKDVMNARRDAKFNALSERAQKQVDILKKAVENSFKSASLQENIAEIMSGKDSERAKSRKIAEEINKTLKGQLKDEETMLAIASYLDIAQKDINGLFKALTSLDTMSVQDKFVILRNALFTIQAYGNTIEELYGVTTEEYLSDEGISSQEFVAEDSVGKLSEFETTSENEPVDTEGLTTSQIAQKIVDSSEDFELSEDETHYINKKTGEKYLRVTEVIASDLEGETFDPNSPWAIPSSNIGTGVDELTRDFMAGRLTKVGDEYKVDGKDLHEVYPNSNKTKLNKFVAQLSKLKDSLSREGITIVPRDVTVNGTIKTIDGRGVVHTVNVAGTLDLLGYDKDGNWYIYDMKTHRSTLGDEKIAKYEKQLTLYKKFLEEKFGIKIKSLSVIPIKVNYPAPLGAGSGSAVYTVSSDKPEGYLGRKGNQLLKDGEVFKGADPFLEETIEVEDRTVNVQYKKLAQDPTNGLGNGRQAVLNAIESTNRLFKDFMSEFSDKAFKEFVEFLKPFVGENIRIQDPETGKMRDVSIANVLMNSPSDVTLMQKWFTTMADNPNAMLKIFDKVVKIAKDEKRLKVIQKAQEIIALGAEYEAKGVRDYDRFFEEDKKNYVMHLEINGEDYSYDRSAYEKAKAAHIETLNKKYGEHPQIGSEEYKKKNKELSSWIKENTEIIKNGDETITIPKHDKYPSKYKKLTSVEREFFDKWIAIKEELDSLIGPNKTHTTNTIKIRKHGIERLRGALSGNAITEFVESVKSKVQRSFDDDTSYVDAKGIRGFDNEEILKLPLYYVHLKGDAKDLSTDMIGTLVAYADMAYNYEAMQKVVNPLEIGRHMVLGSSAKINSTRGGSRIFEQFNFAGKTIKNPLYENASASNMAFLLNDFMESKVYGRYLKDSGETLGVDNNKAAGALLKLGSTVQLGFNLLAWLANATTGVCMQNIEAVAGEFFNARDLAKADAEFTKAMGGFMGDIGQRVKTSKLTLFDEMFDVRQNFRSKVKHKDFTNRNFLTRIFGPGIQYIGQDAGDHWLYNRSAIALAMKYKMKDTKNGNREISLWDALITVPVVEGKPELGMKLVLKEGVVKQDGTEFSDRDISDLSGRMRYINQHTFGVYNEEDAIAARRTILGRFVMQYRDWIPAQFRYRFGSRTVNLEKGGEVEGYYRTSARFVKQIFSELKNGEKNISQVWGDLSDYEKANCVRTITEIGQWLGICVLAMVLKGDGNDKDRPWLMRTLSYLATREKTELGALTPIMTVPEMIKIVKSPVANTSVVSDIYNLTMLLNPGNYTDEIQSGDYKGHSSAYRAFMRSPLTLHYRTIKRTLSPEKAEQFYDRN